MHIAAVVNCLTPEAHTRPAERCSLVLVLIGFRFSIFGIVFGGGAGEALAEWLVEGQPSEDLWELDVRRFGPYASPVPFVQARAREVYEREYAVHYPLEEYRSARPLKADPLYADTHVSVALLYEKLGVRSKALDHWRRYLQLDPAGLWAEIAHQRIEG